MDSYFIKLTGKAELPKPIEISNNFRVLLEGSIVSEKISDNDDGTKDHAFEFKPILVATIDKLGETIKAKDTRGRSVQMRMTLRKEWVDGIDSREFEDYYDARMLELIKKIIEKEI